MRSISGKIGPAAPPELPKTLQSDELQLNVTLVTPMMGGGVDAGVTDMDRPVRAPSVRGHLRWWWRLLYGGDNVADMHERESMIWGSTDRAGAVSISVECDPKPMTRDFHNNYGFERYGSESYALFAALESKIGAIAKEGLSFKLTLRFNGLGEEQLKQVNMSVAAWIYFGGIGARTRRGLGSLKCDNSSLPSFDAVRNALKGRGVSVFTKNAADPMAAWSETLKIYKSYRQQRNGPRGRSYWPEPDALRDITQQRVARHAEPVTKLEKAHAFPRAALGLPIEFKFKDDGKSSSDEPEKQSLYAFPKNSEEPVDRMASPVITKAVHNGSKWYSAFIILPHDHAFDITPCLKPDKHIADVLNVRDARYKQLKSTHGADNAIDGFIAYAGQNSFKELS